MSQVHAQVFPNYILTPIFSPVKPSFRKDYMERLHRRKYETHTVLPGIAVIHVAHSTRFNRRDYRFLVPPRAHARTYVHACTFTCFRPHYGLYKILDSRFNCDVIYESDIFYSTMSSSSE